MGIGKKIMTVLQEQLEKIRYRISKCEETELAFKSLGTEIRELKETLAELRVESYRSLDLLFTIKEMLENGNFNSTNVVTSTKKKEKIEENTFIPISDTAGMALKSGTKTTTVLSDDISSSLEALKNLK